MSAENDSLFPQSDQLFLPEIDGHGGDLDFEKDFFNSGSGSLRDVAELSFHDVCFEAMSGTNDIINSMDDDDDDVFRRLEPLDGPESTRDGLSTAPDRLSPEAGACHDVAGAGSQYFITDGADIQEHLVTSPILTGNFQEGSFQAEGCGVSPLETEGDIGSLQCYYGGIIGNNNPNGSFGEKEEMRGHSQPMMMQMPAQMMMHSMGGQQMMMVPVPMPMPGQQVMTQQQSMMMQQQTMMSQQRGMMMMQPMAASGPLPGQQSMSQQQPMMMPAMSQQQLSQQIQPGMMQMLPAMQHQGMMMIPMGAAHQQQSQQQQQQQQPMMGRHLAMGGMQQHPLQSQQQMAMIPQPMGQQMMMSPMVPPFLQPNNHPPMMPMMMPAQHGMSQPSQQIMMPGQQMMTQHMRGNGIKSRAAASRSVQQSSGGSHSLPPRRQAPSSNSRQHIEPQISSSGPSVKPEPFLEASGRSTEEADSADVKPNPDPSQEAGPSQGQTPVQHQAPSSGTLSPMSSDGTGSSVGRESSPSGLDLNPLMHVDADGDGLRPLRSSVKGSGLGASSAMHRSFSSHALGQMRGGRSPAGEGSSQVQKEVKVAVQQGDQGGRGAVGSVAAMAGMRRVQSTGDIHMMGHLSLPPHMSPGGGYEDSSYRIGRYTMDERRVRIDRYRQKRSERNFNKKIKYACRKTLAESRPRVRGRFAKNEEIEENEDLLEEDPFYEDFKGVSGPAIVGRAGGGAPTAGGGLNSNIFVHPTMANGYHPGVMEMQHGNGVKYL